MRSTLIIFFTLSMVGLSGQTFNQEYFTESGSHFLLGPIKESRLTEGSYGQWFNPGYTNYVVDSEKVITLSDSIGDYDIELFLGTWCGDSKREVPRMLKILEAAGYPKEAIRIYAVDGRREYIKTTPGGEAIAQNIVRVPTLIFSKNGKEVNRIIEKPVISLEEDMAAIIRNKSYVPHYANQKRSD